MSSFATKIAELIVSEEQFLLSPFATKIAELIVSEGNFYFRFLPQREYILPKGCEAAFAAT